MCIEDASGLRHNIMAFSNYVSLFVALMATQIAPDGTNQQILFGHQPTVPLHLLPIPFWSVFAQLAAATSMNSMAAIHLPPKCFVKDKSTG